MYTREINSFSVSFNFDNFQLALQFTTARVLEYLDGFKRNCAKWHRDMKHLAQFHYMLSICALRKCILAAWLFIFYSCRMFCHTSKDSYNSYNYNENVRFISTKLWDLWLSIWGRYLRKCPNLCIKHVLARPVDPLAHL